MQALLAIVKALQVPMLALHDFNHTQWYTYISAWMLRSISISAELYGRQLGLINTRPWKPRGPCLKVSTRVWPDQLVTSAQVEVEKRCDYSLPPSPTHSAQKIVA